MRIAARQVAKILQVSERRVVRLFTEGKLPGHRVGEEVRFSRAEVLEWAALHRKEVAPEVLAEPAGGAGTLRRALRRGGIHYGLPGGDRDALLRAVVDRLPIADPADRDFLVEVLRARERVASTAIGEGIALPHPRNPVVWALGEPLVSLCFPGQPVDFGAADGQPVHAIFTILAPTVPLHLLLLGRISLCLRDDELRALLRAGAEPERIQAAVARLEAGLDEPGDRSAAPDPPPEGTVG